jgi:hypothetical protein
MRSFWVMRAGREVLNEKGRWGGEHGGASVVEE